ncbi:MAG TPA: tripartite tricarboxylate transporter substrate binding protein [Burkholderiales bacterium]
MRPLAVFLLLLISATGAAQPFPSKPIRCIVPSSPGGGADTTARLVAAALPAVLGEQVVVENRAGASGNIGTAAAAKSPPDGYTWILINNAQAANATLQKDPNFDLLRDFAPVTQVDSSPHIVLVHPSVPVNSIQELVALAKSRPLDYASAGTGTVTFLAAELFNAQAGISLRHVPYKGGGESLLSVVRGETSVYFSPLSVALGHVRANRVRALAVTSKTRLPTLPEVPTVAESGYPSYEFNLWNGFLVPANTPKDVIATIHRAVVGALNSPEVKKRFVELGTAPVGNRPEEFGALIKSEVESYAELVKKLKLSGK